MDMGPTTDLLSVGRLALDCLLMRHEGLGGVCHCLANTFATLAANEDCAHLIMNTPKSAALRAIMTLLDVTEAETFASTGHVRKCACTCLAFLASHPIGVKGDACLSGPFRKRLLQMGAFTALLKAALLSPKDDASCDLIIQQAAAIGIMYLCTMVIREVKFDIESS